MTEEYDYEIGDIPYCDCDLGMECICENCKEQNGKPCECENITAEEDKLEEKMTLSKWNGHIGTIINHKSLENEIFEITKISPKYHIIDMQIDEELDCVSIDITKKNVSITINKNIKIIKLNNKDTNQYDRIEIDLSEFKKMFNINHEIEFIKQLTKTKNGTYIERMVFYWKFKTNENSDLMFTIPKNIDVREDVISCKFSKAKR